MTRCDCLVEIGTEELPAQPLCDYRDTFLNNLTHQLAVQSFDFATAQAFATPRRLAVLVSQVRTRQPDKIVERKGPALSAAFTDDGVPSKACLGFARSCGVEPDQLIQKDTPKGTWLIHRQHQPGQHVADCVSSIVNETLQTMPIQRTMYWEKGKPPFARPIRWILLQIDNACIHTSIMGLTTGKTTRGHRLCAQPVIQLDSARDYEQDLEKYGHVIACFKQRKTQVQTQMETLAHDHNLVAKIEPKLLDEVVGLVEWPQALIANFDPRFLHIPPEVLTTAMQHHQKVFPCQQTDGRLAPHFIAVSNTLSTDLSIVKRGNERVMQARLADAEFFYKTDLKKPLEQRVRQLNTILFEKELGSLLDKTQRICHLCHQLAEHFSMDVTTLSQAAHLCKADLTTEVVGEFPELQGIMGAYYAEQAGYTQSVQLAIRQHYLPRHADDALPTSADAQILAVADKLDTVVGFFIIGKTPSGDKDPYAIRRAMLGILRIVLANQWPFSWQTLFTLGASAYHEISPQLIHPNALLRSLATFAYERHRALAIEQGVHPDIFKAISPENSAPADLAAQATALDAFYHQDQARDLSLLAKRVRKLLQKQFSCESMQTSKTQHVNFALFKHQAEHGLAEALSTASLKINQALENKHYRQAYHQLAALNQPLAHFFDHVMVLAEEDDLRTNRLVLLTKLHELITSVADFSVLH